MKYLKRWNMVYSVRSTYNFWFVTPDGLGHGVVGFGQAVSILGARAGHPVLLPTCPLTSTSDPSPS